MHIYIYIYINACIDVITCSSEQKFLKSLRSIERKVLIIKIITKKDTKEKVLVTIFPRFSTENSPFTVHMPSLPRFRSLLCFSIQNKSKTHNFNDEAVKKKKRKTRDAGKWREYCETCFPA